MSLILKLNSSPLLCSLACYLSPLQRIIKIVVYCCFLLLYLHLLMLKQFAVWHYSFFIIYFYTIIVVVITIVNLIGSVIQQPWLFFQISKGCISSCFLLGMKNFETRLLLLLSWLLLVWLALLFNSLDF